MRLDIYNDNISYVTDEVSTIPTDEANLNEENRMKFVTDVAAISRGKYESKNPKVRYEALLKEAALGTPSRPLEFLPVVLTLKVPDLNWFNCRDYDSEAIEFDIPYDIHIGLTDFVNKIGKFSYIKKNKVYTNMRCLLNAGFVYEHIPYNTKEELKDFKVLRANIPMFVFAQFPATHTQISSEAQSDRVTENANYWLPSDIEDRINKHLDKVKEIDRHFVDILAKQNRATILYKFRHEIGETYVQLILKEIGYPREIWSRAPYYFKYKETVMGGWLNNPYVWNHAFLERGAKPDEWKNWTQNETRLFVTKCKEIIEKGS